MIMTTPDAGGRSTERPYVRPLNAQFGFTTNQNNIRNILIINTEEVSAWFPGSCGGRE